MQNSSYWSGHRFTLETEVSCLYQFPSPTHCQEDTLTAITRAEGDA